jgi:hypothetical protein
MGTILMAFGALLAATDRRYRVLAKRSAASDDNTVKATA